MNGKQSRMARAAFDMSAADLADKAGVGRMTVVRFEAGEVVAADSAQKITTALEEAGAQFSRRAGRVGVTVPE